MDECGFRQDPSRVRRLGLPSDYPSVNVLGYIPLFDGFPVFMSFSSNILGFSLIFFTCLGLGIPVILFWIMLVFIRVLMF